MEQSEAATVDVLVIDDDGFSQKVIGRTLTDSGLQTRFASDGESGLTEAWKTVPDIILLDVEMPGLNGYEVCDRLRSSPLTRETPVIFLSGCSSLRERMLGYEVGADDYLIKPFEAENLIARIKVLLKYREQRSELKGQYELACKAAIAAMAGTSELNHTLRFMEQSFEFVNIDQLVEALLEFLDRFSLNACLMLMIEDVPHWYSSDGDIKPLEQELILMSDASSRFVDFGLRTLVIFNGIRLLVRNMPLNDMERYGRIKDLLPVLLTAAQVRIGALNTRDALTEQSHDLLRSFGGMRNSLFRLVKTLVENRKQSQLLTAQTISAINDDLFRMGLDEYQETYLLQRVESTIDKVVQQMDAGEQIRIAFTDVLASMKGVVAKQESLVHAINSVNDAKPASETAFTGDVELF